MCASMSLSSVDVQSDGELLDDSNYCKEFMHIIYQYLTANYFYEPLQLFLSWLTLHTYQALGAGAASPPHILAKIH